ncbi:rab-GTPase-TBC domain-containing protein [Mycotypha africana]|uniref:rab-GTPase-TBC domain-containing protein n=1 Tax=Mycotypha africana TaxID=64632 RepID=UPI0023005400|nr:rab-GTPase-TBC domain-containing protein [Mycotypha africana]KAI8967703.1 rab-GTPase-TBC domain-containing protein [Mycotypha africana]
MTIETPAVILDNKEQQQQHESGFLLEKDTVITNESVITLRSSHSGASSRYSDDAESTDHDSFDTIAATEEYSSTTKDPVSRRRDRALTVTQESQQQQQQSDTIQKELHDLETMAATEAASIVPSSSSSMLNDDDGRDINHLEDDHHSDISSSDYDNDDVPRTNRRHEGHRSTMSSIHSFVSSASNYDLLLARLGSRDNATSLSNDNNSSTDTVDKVMVASKMDDKDAATSSIDSIADEDEIDWEFWSKLISNFTRIAKSDPKNLSYNVHKGIPPSLRGMIWPLFAKSNIAGSCNLKNGGKLEDQYLQLLKEESVYEKAIMRDLAKLSSLSNTTSSCVNTESGQDEALFNLIKAYSLYDKEIGYSQGLLYIAGPLLSNMPEEEAFSVLVQLMNKYNLRGQFLPQPELLHTRLYQLEGLIGDYLPHVQRRLKNHNIQTNMYAQSWFGTMFACKLPLNCVSRIYDIIFAEGFEAMFKFAIALLEKNQATILSFEFDELVNFLKGDLFEAYKGDVNQFIKDACQIHITRKRLDRLAKAYQIESAKVNNEAEAIESLKRQNKALTESIREMDHEYNNLNKEHTIVAKELITAKMNIARIHDENEALRQQCNELKKTLETLPKEVEARVKEEIEILYTKNAALVERNSALEDQLAYMENMIIDIKTKYSESENERKGLKERLVELKRLMG